MGDLTLKDIAQRWKEALNQGERPPFPIPLFNSVSIQGHCVVLRPLAKELYTRKELHRVAADSSSNQYQRRKAESPTWVYYRTGIYGLDDLLGTLNPKLSEAVRASAHFPFGFPLVKAAAQTTPIFSPDLDHKKVRPTDGAVASGQLRAGMSK